MAEQLAARTCKPCSGETPVLSEEQAREFSRQLPEWQREGNKKIRREFKFGSFEAAREWINHMAEIAEEEDHHPDLQWYYNKVIVELSTHKIGGLSENDFIMGAKIDRIP